MSAGADLIRLERLRQLKVEGFSIERDVVQYREGQLALAAWCYLTEHPVLGGAHSTPGEVPDAWPWHPEWWKPSASGDEVRNLVKAGALIAAEVDRLLAARGGA